VALQSVFTPGQFTAADAGAAQTAHLEASGMQGYHILNRSDQWVNLTDDAGTLLDVIPPWFDTTNTIMLGTRGIGVTMPASAAAGSLAINGVSAASYQFLIQFYAEPLPVQRTQLAAPTAATGGGAQLIQGAISSTITSGTVSVSGPVSTTQSGSWSVAASQFGSWNVAAVQSGTWNVAATQSGTWNLLAQQSGSWNVAISGNVTVQAATGGVAIVNSPGSNVNVSTGSGVTLAATGVRRDLVDISLTGPAGTVIATVITPAASDGGLSFLVRAANILSRIQVFGTSTGFCYLDLNPPGIGTYVLPLLTSFDPTYNVQTTTGTSVGNFLFVAAIQDAITTVPLNYGNAPLITQPASGSSQTVIPGTAATTAISAGFLGATPTFVDFGAAFTCPTNLYGFSAAVFAEYGSSTQPTGYAMALMTVGLRGVTSGKRMPLCSLSCSAVPPSTSNGTAGQWSLSGSANTSLVFPFPLPFQQFFTAGESLQPYYGEIANLFNGFGAQLNLFTN
jgi:hypothetical protein